MTADAGDPAGEWRNEVCLLGRVSASPEHREMPSGDVVVLFRLVVPRAATGAVDTIDVACWAARPRRSAARLQPGDHVEVAGALRRRFFRSGGAAVSRYEVEAATVRRRRPPG